MTRLDRQVTGIKCQYQHREWNQHLTVTPEIIRLFIFILSIPRQACTNTVDPDQIIAPAYTVFDLITTPCAKVFQNYWSNV